ncbi:MAG: nucleotidyltransferase domain-containing protein, partial [Bacteroidota bacterium]
PDSAGPELFLPQEIQLLSSITSRVGLFLYHREIEGLLQNRQQNLVMKQHENIHWKWRNEMVGLMMKHIKPDEFGIISVYLIGSTKNGNPGPGSDIDLIIHHTGDHAKTNAMKQWFEGWSLCLAYMNFRQTGYRMDEGIIDLHLIRDEDIEKRTSYATMIGSCMNSAKQIYTRKND